MVNSWKTAALIGACCLFTGGCAKDAIRLERASTMVAAGRAVEVGTSGLLEKTRLANREVLISVVSADPNCNLPRPLIMRPPIATGALYCRPRGANPVAEDWLMRRITERDLNITLAVVRSLAGYIDLIDAVITREPLDIGGEFATALSDLETVRDAANAITGADVGVPALSSEQSGAIKGALDLLTVILDERYRVNDLRRIETIEQRGLFSDTIIKLRQANSKWLDIYGSELAKRRILLAGQLRRMPGTTAAVAAARRPVAEALLSTIEEQEKESRISVALADVVDKLELSHNAYLALLDNPNAELTKKERAKLAQLNRERVMGALRSLTALLKAF